MRKRHLLVASVSVVFLSACVGSNNDAISSDLQKDLELASSSDGISLGNRAITASVQFVSAIEQTTPPARKVATSARVKRHRPVPKEPPQVVETEAPADVIEDVESVATADADLSVSPRPQPVAVSYPGGSSSVGSGSGTGAVLGTIFGVVVRGGGVGDIDHCDPRRTSRPRGTVISINNRMPFPTTRSRLGRVAIGGRAGNGNIASRFPH